MSTTSAPTHIFEHPSLGRRVRSGDWEDQAISTFQKIVDAVDLGGTSPAIELVDLCVAECKVIRDIMIQWQADVASFLSGRGVPIDEIEAERLRLIKLSKYPSGAPFDGAQSWDDFVAFAAELKHQIERRVEVRLVSSHVTAMREFWRQFHDRDGDLTQGLMALVVRRFGEGAVPALYDHIAGPWFDQRYSRFDVSRRNWQGEALDELLYVTFESMRAHLSTPARDGRPLDVSWQEDRVVFTFDPCGSGGRMTAGDAVEGSPPRMHPPYGFPVIEGAHDWTDGKKGVCIYCNHCQVMMEHMPMDRYGYPIRTVEPPLYDVGTGKANPEKCTWTVFLDPTTVPESYYHRAGRQRPTAFGSKKDVMANSESGHD